MQTQRSTQRAIVEKPESLVTPHGNALRLTAAGKERFEYLLRRAHAKGIGAFAFTQDLNQEFGLDRDYRSYYAAAKRLGLIEFWPRAVRIGLIEHRSKPIELLPADQRHCVHCGENRELVPYSISGRVGLPTFLCKSHHCQDLTCGVQLEVHEIKSKGTAKVEARFWAHPFPVPERLCENPNCGKRFVPEDRKNPHQAGCSKPCTQIISSAKYRREHPEKQKEYNKRSGKNRQRKVWLAAELEQENAELKAKLRNQAPAKKDPGRKHEPEEEKSYYKIGLQVEMEIPNDQKTDRHALISARRLVTSRHPRYGYDLVAQYHKGYRQTVAPKDRPSSSPSKPV